MSVVTPPARPKQLSQLEWNERVYQGVLSASLASLGFFLLFSIAGVYLSMGVLLMLCLVAPARIWRTRPWREPLLALGLLLLGYIALRTVLGEGWNRGSLLVVHKYHELLFLPLLWALLRNARWPQAFSNGLVAGALVLAVLYWVGFFLGLDLTNVLGVWLHTRRISAGFGLAICAFLLFEHARLGRLPRRAGYGAALFLVFSVAFAIDGRTGHVVVLVLLCCAAFRAAPRRAGIAAAAGAAIFAVLVGALSHSVRDRVLESFHGVQTSLGHEAGPVSSTTARFEVWQSATVVARENWLLGVGWGHYAKAADEASRRRHADPRLVPGAQSDNPHSEYLMQLASGGVPALLLFLLWIAWPVWAGVRPGGAGKHWTGVLACVALAFAIAAAFNSLLFDFVEAHFYVALMSWLLVSRVENERARGAVGEFHPAT